VPVGHDAVNVLVALRLLGPLFTQGEGLPIVAPVARSKFFYRSELDGALTIEDQLVADLKSVLPQGSTVELTTYVFSCCSGWGG
jgi:hypothetical protein